MSRYLVVRIGALGDAIHALPLVNALKDLEPGSEIDWLAGPGVARFLAGHPAISRIVVMKRSLAGILAARREIRGRYDAAIDAQGLMKSAWLAAAAASRVIGRNAAHVRERPAAWFYTDPVEIAAAHVIDQNLELLSPLHPDIDEITPRFDAPVDEAPPWPLMDRHPVLFNIGGGWWTKLWPVESFIELAARIEAVLGVPVGVVWGPGEEEDARRIAEASPCEIAPPTTFRQLGALFRRARLVVSGETGPLHLAAAVGCRTVALLGPTAAARNGPYGEGHRVVEPRPDLSCRPCHARSCADFRCMTSIGVDRVFEAVASIE